MLNGGMTWEGSKGEPQEVIKMLNPSVIIP